MRSEIAALTPNSLAKSASFMAHFPFCTSTNSITPVIPQHTVLNSVPKFSGLRGMKETLGNPPVEVVWGRHADMISSRTSISPAVKRSLRAALKSAKSLSIILHEPVTGTSLFGDLQYATASKMSENLAYVMPYCAKFGAGTNPMVLVAHSAWPCARQVGRNVRQRSLAVASCGARWAHRHSQRRARKVRASYLLAVQCGRDEQSVPQKPLPRGDGLPLAVLLRHETVRAIDILLGDAGVHVAEQPEQVEVVEFEADEFGLPDGVRRRVAVVLGHDFPSRVVHLHLLANLPGELFLRLSHATRVALLARLVHVGINVFVEEVILDVVVVLVVVGHEELFSTAKRALERVPVLIGVGAAEVVRVELVPVRVVLRVVSPVKMEDYSSVRQVTRERGGKSSRVRGWGTYR